MSVSASRLRRLVGGLLAGAMIVSAVPVVPAAATVTATSTAPRKYEGLKPGGARTSYRLKARVGTNAVVRWAPGIQQSQINAAAIKFGFAAGASKLFGYTLLTPKTGGLTADQLVGKLREAGLVTRADTTKRFSAATNDPRFGQQWALENTGQEGGTAGADIEATGAWSTTTGSKSVIVAVVDTGVDIGHPDLKNEIWTNTREIPNNDVDDDGNGYADDVHGYDFANGDGTVYDREEGDEHGTHVAGIIGAEGNNSIGVSGVNQHVTIMPVKGLNGFGEGDDYSLAQAMKYAVDNGANVINASWGGYDYSDVLKDACDYAASHGVIVSAAAGNDANDNDQWGFYPAAFDSATIVSVAATDRNDKLADFSNYGADSVDLAAPGVDVMSTLPDDLTGVFADRPGYKAMFLAFAPEVLQPEGVANDIIGRSIKQAEPTTSTPVLVVDDSMPLMTGETPGTRLKVYTDALDAAGYENVDSWSTEVLGSPTAADLWGKTVVWFTGKASYGWYEPWTLDENDRAALSVFLDGGGSFVLASGEAATEDMWQAEEGADVGQSEEPGVPGEGPSDAPGFIAKYFGVTALDYIPWTNEIQGAPGTDFESIDATIPANYMTPSEDSKDWPTAADIIAAFAPWAKPAFTAAPYGAISGTSMAAPHVAGAAALIEAAHPGISADEVIARISNTVDRTDELSGKTAFGGRLNVNAALAAYPGRPSWISPKNGTLLHPGDRTISWAPASGGSAEATFEVQAATPKTTTLEDFEGGTAGIFSSETTVSWEVTSSAESVHGGDYALMSGKLDAVLPPLYPEVDEDGGISFELWGNTTSTETTVTVPEGGGDLDFWWWYEADYTNTFPVFLIDDQVAEWPGVNMPWTEVKQHLSPGQHRLQFDFVKFSALPMGRDGMGIDDVTLTTYDFTPVATTVAGDHDATYTVPAQDMDGLGLRVRSHLNGTASSWAWARDLRVSTDAVAPAAPELTVTQDGNGFVTANWTKPSDGDLDSLRIVRTNGAVAASDPEDSSVHVTYSGSEAGTETESPFKNGTQLTYTAFAVDKAGNWSTPSTQTITVSDTTAPTTVTGLKAQIIDGVVALGWRNPRPNTYTAIKVLRRTDTTPTAPTDSAATVVYDGPTSEAWDFALTLRPVDLNAYYAVYAHDYSDNYSEAATTKIAVDTIGPRGDMLLNNGAEYSKSAIITVTSNVVRATQMRFDTGSGFGDWVPFSASQTLHLADVEGPQTVVGQYRDVEGVTLELESEIYVNLRAPSAPTQVVASTWSDKVLVSWYPNEEMDVASYNVYYATSPTGTYTKANIDPWTRRAVPIEDSSYYVPNLRAGTKYYFKVQAVDIAGLASAMSAPVSATPTWGMRRLYSASTDKYKNIAVISKQFKTAPTAVLVCGDSPSDMAAAAALAGVYHSPLLMGKSTGLSTDVINQIKALGVKKVVVVGVEAYYKATSLRGLPTGISKQYIGSTNRYYTSRLVADEVARLTGNDFAGEAFLVNGNSYAEAAAVAPLAYSQKMPVLFADPAHPTVCNISTGTKPKIGRVYIVGSTRTVSTTMANATGIRLKVRIYGSNVYATAAALAERAVELGWSDMSWTGVACATDYADAFAGAAAMGERGGVMLLTQWDMLSDDTYEEFAISGLAMDKVLVFGPDERYGLTHVSREAYTEIKWALDDAAAMGGGFGGGEEFPF